MTDVRRILFALAVAVAVPAAAVAQAVQQVSYSLLDEELVNRIDFESYPRLMSPGQVLDNVQAFDGATIGERFQGQLLGLENGFDALHFMPEPPLALRAGVAGQNLAVEFVFFMSNQLKGMAPPGFPEREAGGEGAVSILFDRDQSALGFRVASEPDPKDAGIPKGRMLVSFFRRDGYLIDQLDIELSWLLAGYGFRRVNGAEDIAGISITNRDPQGVMIDDVIFDRNPVLGLLGPEP